MACLSTSFLASLVDEMGMVGHGGGWLGSVCAQFDLDLWSLSGGTFPGLLGIGTLSFLLVGAFVVISVPRSTVACLN